MVSIITNTLSTDEHPRLIYLVGQPGSGKSTLMRRLTEDFGRLPVETPVPHDTLLTNGIAGDITHIEIGRQRGDFSGTDALASSIITKAAPWIETQPYPVVLAEGARLANRRFLEAAVRGGYFVLLVVLDHPDAEAWRVIRSRQLGHFQNNGWVRGRLKASQNLAADPPEGVGVLRGHPDDLIDELAKFARFKQVVQ